jgi:hypothetical protein
LTLFDQLRIHTALAVPGHDQVEPPRGRLHALLPRAVVGVALRTAMTHMRGRAPVGGQLRVQGALHQPFRQVFESPMLPEEILRRGIIREQCVSQGFLRGVYTGHLVLLVLSALSIKITSYTVIYIPSFSSIRCIRCSHTSIVAFLPWPVEGWGCPVVGHISWMLLP